MNERPVPEATIRDWSDALLTSGTEALLGAVRNYIGPIKTPYDKRDLVAGLEAFLRRTETKDSLLALLDPLDVRILGSSLLLGSVPEQVLKDLFSGELPLFELGVRISNLLDRLLLFRYQSGGRRLVAVNPLLEEELRARAIDSELFFSSGSERGRSVPTDDATGSSLGSIPVDAGAAVVLFSFLLHAPLSTRKGGGLTKRGLERVAALLPELAVPEGDRLGTLAQALSASGVVRMGEDDERCLDREAFARLLSEWGECLPYYLAACTATEGGDGGAADSLAIVLASAMESLPLGRVMPRSVLARWVRIVAHGANFTGGAAGADSVPVDPAAALASLEAFGILSPRGDGFVPILPGAHVATRTEVGAVLVAEGSHALHLMPEASLEDRLFVGCVAKPTAIGKVWSFDVERDTVRRAFAAGLSAPVIKARFESLSGASLPQSFAFSLSAWEEEYRSLRLYRGFVLVADERQRLVIERSVALGKIMAERLAAGIYFLSVSTPDEAVAVLMAAGLESPPLTQATAPHFDSPSSSALFGPSLSEKAGKTARGRIDALCDLVRPAVFQSGVPVPGPEVRLSALRAILSASSRTEEERRELADRIERRLVLTERQIAQSDPRPDRLEAGGLDYLGKVRVVERSLRAVGDRLEVLYRLPGEEPVRALLRPVRLDKNEKGLILEAEDLLTGSPARVPLGAVSTVRRVRASLFGEDQ